MAEATLRAGDVQVDDTFAEAFPVVGTRLIITADTAELARVAATEMSGYASSIIGCDAEADIERNLAAAGTPDGRPGTSVRAYLPNNCLLQRNPAGQLH